MSSLADTITNYHEHHDDFHHEFMNLMIHLLPILPNNLKLQPQKPKNKQIMWNSAFIFQLEWELEIEKKAQER